MKHIVLVDYSLGGHHLSFLKSFSAILLAMGHRVFVLVPEAHRLEAEMQREPQYDPARFHAVHYEEKPHDGKGWGRFSDTVRVLRKWRHEAGIIRDMERQYRVRMDMVFHAWLDHHLARYVHPRLLDLVFPYKWSGLYFHPYHLRLEPHNLQRRLNWKDIDSIFLSKNCLGVAIHDAAIRENFATRTGKPVIHFPETADDTAPDYEYPLYREIKAAAGERLVVGMIGCEKHKGTLTLMRMAAQADPGTYFFVFLGILPRDTYTEAEWAEVSAYIDSAPENACFRFESVPEGGPYNAVFCALDIPFLVYDNFISSSNRLTKAALFEKLVLASDNHCVGDDVRKYELGEAVAPQQTETALAGLLRLTERIRRQDFPVSQWQTYREINSVALLRNRFQEILQHLP